VGRKPIGLEAVIDPIPVAPLADEIGGLEDREMSRDRRSRDVESGGDRARGKLSSLQLLEDLAACRIREGAEDACGLFHSFTI